MASSTSRSRPSLPVFAVLLLSVALAALGLCAVYTLRLNPELNFFVAADRVQSQWADKMTREHGAKLVVFGGSSCLFSIDAERLLSVHHLPAVNMGRGAGMGASVLTVAAVHYTRPGDTLVAAIEPSLLTGSLAPTAMGVQFSVITGHTDWVTRPAVGENSLSLLSVLLNLRPGGYHALTMLGKLAGGKPSFRYQVSDIGPSGVTHTRVRLPINGPSRYSGVLSEEAQRFLAALREWSQKHQVRVAYSLPWSFSPPDRAHAYQRLNAGFLLEIMRFVPVLRDPRLGAHTVREHFADTELHLTTEGAALRTDELADQIKQWRVWTSEELSQEAHSPDAQQQLVSRLPR